MRTAVLIHGFHLDSRLTVGGKTCDWHDLAIGEVLLSGRATGRATHGVIRAWRERAELVIFSTGASKKEGLFEAEYTYRAVRQRLGDLAVSLMTQAHVLDTWLLNRVRLDTESQTTDQELRRNLRLCADEGVQRVILATNRFHAPRALANAIGARRALGLPTLEILATAPDDASPTPLIFEPPTRPDRPGVAWNEVLRDVFNIPAERQGQAAEAIARTIKAFCKA